MIEDKRCESHNQPSEEVERSADAHYLHLIYYCKLVFRKHGCTPKVKCENHYYNFVVCKHTHIIWCAIHTFVLMVHISPIFSYQVTHV